MKLNSNSKKMVQNIVNGFKNYPPYKEYEINSYCYNWRMGVHALSITQNGIIINLWLFYPGINGEIGSIAVYGAGLNGHFNAIRNTMTVFRLPVENITMDCGMEEFLDITIAPYNECLNANQPQALNREKFDEAANSVIHAFLQYLPIMSDYKKYIQTTVLFVATQDELNAVRNCVFNQSLVNKLVDIARRKWERGSKDTQTLYCAAMAVGTIIKEYDWGVQYVMPDGLYELANNIWSN